MIPKKVVYELMVIIGFFKVLLAHIRASLYVKDFQYCNDQNPPGTVQRNGFTTFKNRGEAV